MFESQMQKRPIPNLAPYCNGLFPSQGDLPQKQRLQWQRAEPQSTDTLSLHIYCQRRNHVQIE